MKHRQGSRSTNSGGLQRLSILAFHACSLSLLLREAPRGGASKAALLHLPNHTARPAERSFRLSSLHSSSPTSRLALRVICTIRLNVDTPTSAPHQRLTASPTNLRLRKNRQLPRHTQQQHRQSRRHRHHQRSTTTSNWASTPTTTPTQLPRPAPTSAPTWTQTTMPNNAQMPSNSLTPTKSPTPTSTFISTRRRR
ncbi:unnamed protein product [Protopolystoma xenopodis]|uniref:Uncharacterized protein n=1 Tax=Protopolystoma xenopodis TaxID=117903 RepID=A0A448XAW3_9PLAT|nr:unnamed protein product [Protopolystoma xenopodis]